MSLLQKGVITRRIGLQTFRPTGLAPQKIVDVYTDWATGDVHQRKVCFTGTRFWVFYWEGVHNSTKRTCYTSSLDGITWETSAQLDAFSVGPGALGNAGNCDIEYAPSLDMILNMFLGSGAATYFYGSAISGAVLTRTNYGSVNYGTQKGGRITLLINSNARCVTNTSGFDSLIFVEPSGVSMETYAIRDANITYAAGNGGAVTLRYKITSPYTTIYIIKSGDATLRYGTGSGININSGVVSSAVGVTLASGHSSFCATSEANSASAPERIHLVYIKSTGELCYMKFENDAWGSEKILVSSGATYPVIAVGSSGKLYVFYVVDGKIWVKHNNGNWLNPVELFTADHTYDMPVYLSCNQNAENGKICLVWTEGTVSYAVWFCYLED